MRSLAAKVQTYVGARRELIPAVSVRANASAIPCRAQRSSKRGQIAIAQACDGRSADEAVSAGSVLTREQIRSAEIEPTGAAVDPLQQQALADRHPG